MILSVPNAGLAKTISSLLNSGFDREKCRSEYD
jgi:hypothetical protein